MRLVDYAKIILRARPIDSPERHYFERIIIPAAALYGVRRALFVGVAPFTWHYQQLFRRAGIEYWTVDRRPEAAVWGSRGRHVIGDITNVGATLRGRQFDLIVMMGMIGYGLDTEEQVRSALEETVTTLESTGRILVACESKFNLDPVEIGKTMNPALLAADSFCFPAKVSMPEFDYGFYFLKPAAS